MWGYYKDRTFCSAKCKNKKCIRQYNHKENVDNVPVSMSDFSGHCDRYEEETDNEEKN